MGPTPIPNSLDGQLSVGIPLVPKCMYTGEVGTSDKSLQILIFMDRCFFKVFQNIDGPRRH